MKLSNLPPGVTDAMIEENATGREDHRSEDTKTWFKVHGWKPEILTVDVVKVTAHFVTFMEKSWAGGKPYTRREAKDGNYFPTWGQAHMELLDRVTREVKGLEESLQRARTKLGQVQSLEKPQ